MADSKENYSWDLGSDGFNWGIKCLVPFVIVLTTTTTYLPHVWETWMNLTNKHLLVDIFLYGTAVQV